MMMRTETAIACRTTATAPSTSHASSNATKRSTFVAAAGDEGLPYCFISGAEGCPNWGPRMKALQGAFVMSYERANPDMQSKYSYEPDEPMKGNLAICRS